MRYTLSIFAFVGLIFGAIMVFISLMKPPTPPIPFAPALSPYEHAIAGSGMVEAASEDVSISVPFSEIVEEVFVNSGDVVEEGAPLFQMDTQNFNNQLEEARRDHEVAYTNYQKQLDLPRPEDVPILEDIVKQAEMSYQDKIAQFEVVKKVTIPKAVSADEYNKRKYAEEIAKYRLDETKSRLALLQAGAWVADLAIYRAELKRSKARIELIETQIERSTIRAPFAGMVLQVNVHPGELAQETNLSPIPLMLFGNVDPLHIRVDIDEEDVWRVIEGAQGTAFVRGNSEIHVPLKFFHLKPYLVPKRYLTGDNDERVDTRVLQITYSFEREDLPIYPGQIMDVFLEAKPNL